MEGNGQGWKKGWREGTPRSAEPLWLSKPGAVSVRERSGDI